MKVRHRLGEYEVVKGDVSATLQEAKGACIITDENVARHWITSKDNVLVLPPGEQTKSLSQFEHALKWLAANKASRSSTVIALGGGVIGDLAGYVAASYMRGVRLIQIPTTLLSMVDSSVGGKVAVNLEEGKNLVGAFYPPSKVVLDFQTLSTLPDTEFTSGAAEIWKYALIMDWSLFQQLETKPLGPDDDRIPEIVIRCVDHKRRVVEEDEFETTGRRAILNFGHTVGHAVEKLTGYRSVLHGEAVAMGMIVEADLGERLGVTPKGLAGRIHAGMQAQNLPTKLPTLNPTDLVDAMKLDKKAASGSLAFALLDGYGSCKLMPDVPEPVVLECLQEHL